jgi:hypothetical protein
MCTHPEYTDLMVEALYGEIAPEDRRRLEEHLDDCEDCAAEFAELRATLDVMAQRERPEPPEAYWAQYRRRLDARRAARARASGDRSASLRERLRRWWASLSPMLPQTEGQWALQGAVALLLLIVGLWGGQQMDGTGLAGRPEGSGSPAAADRLPASAEPEERRPLLHGVEDIAFDVQEGTVSVRYRALDVVTVRGRPEDPAIQRLLRAALLDEGNPASQLHAMKTLERGAVAPSEDLVQALAYLVREEGPSSLRLRAVRALRALHQNRGMDPDTRSVLLDLLLDTTAAEPLRVEALQTLLAPPSRLEASALYPVRDDSNAYLRYQARTLLREAQAPAPMSN